MFCASRVTAVRRLLSTTRRAPGLNLPSLSLSSSSSSSSSLWQLQQRCFAAKSESGDPLFDLTTAVKLARATRVASRMDETLSITLNTGLDPRKSNQQLRGAVQLPHGTGRKVRVAVFADGPKAQEALDAGADIVGTDSLVEQIREGKIDFDRCIATPNMMPVVGKVARILGPLGLVPSPKLNTLTMDVADAVKKAKQGEIIVKADEVGRIRATVGKLSFTSEQLTENIVAMLKRVLELRPEGHSKGALVRDAMLNSSKGFGIRVQCNQAPFK